MFRAVPIRRATSTDQLSNPMANRALSNSGDKEEIVERVERIQPSKARPCAPDGCAN